ncbi:MAG TPA: SpoIIE family protein phosphatase [Candidatus Rifleibacterium sp.]|jgi:serine phosphatase RsbU (regulator of sigma subunit)|nr:SpoIIE family protein phosphatase [Candidatus Rifleibacterium sp.]HPW57417.1 SpoIIE family protein phosphatase [Candidatus Rifleibacterium sp.]
MSDSEARPKQSLQRRLAKVFLVILLLFVILFALNWLSFSDIEDTVNVSLPVNIKIARAYEELAAKWTQLGETVTESLKSGPEVAEQDNSEKLHQLELVIDRIEKLIDDPARLEVLTHTRLMFDGFKKHFISFDLLLKSRNRMLRKNADRRSKAAEGLRADVTSLLDRFKSMIVDLNSTLKNPDFQASLGNTSSLMEKISRVEKDLILAETEVALYLSLKKGKEQSDKSEKSSAGRVESRFRAILYLLGRSIQESNVPLHKRVLTQVEAKIKGFFDSFNRLRNLLEAPESELLETEDQLLKMQKEITSFRQKGVNAAKAEADRFWNQINSISEDLIARANRNSNFTQTFLLLIGAISAYLAFFFPTALGGPLKLLSEKVASFRLGSDFKAETSEIEEIDSLGKAFALMCERLNLQGEVNRNYLSSIHGLTKYFRELHETETRPDRPNERLEKAVNLILKELIEQNEKFDLIKVMVIQTNPETGEKFFVRLGEHEFSERFMKSPEFEPYCLSAGVNLHLGQPAQEERIPFEKGLTGWYFEFACGIKAGVEADSFFREVYSSPPIKNNPVLADREYEKGLAGSLLLEPLNVPGDNDNELQTPRGILFVYSLDEKTRLSWQEIFFVQIIAGQIASIIETDALLKDHDKKKIIDDQLTMAKEIQDNLLPKSVPQMPGLRINKINKSAAEVGGDYFDFFVLDKNRIGVVIADASGKNVPAAIIMTVFKTTLSTMELDKMGAGEVLTRANNIIAKNITNDRFITAMYVIIDAETGNVEMASAGHNPAFVSNGYGHNHILREKSEKGLPLGILEDYEYGSKNFQLVAGDLLLLYTDGVTEARNSDDEEFGDFGLKRFLARVRGKNPAQDLLDAVEEFAYLATQHDDITAVTIEYDGSKA